MSQQGQLPEAQRGVGDIYQPHEAWRLDVIGVPGQGKSVYRNWLLALMYRIVLWNPMEDYHVGEVITVPEFRDRVNSFRNGVLRITVVPTTYNTNPRLGMTIQDEYNELCALVYEVGNLHFATEEIGLVASPNQVPPNLNMLCIKGRHVLISLSFFGQRFHQFPLIVRGTASEIIAYRQVDPDDVQDFYDRISPAESPMPLNELPDHHYIRWTPQGGAVFCAPLPHNPRAEPEA